MDFLQNSYMALLQQVIANVLPDQQFGTDLPLQDMLLNLINTVEKDIQFLTNIESAQQFDTQLSLTLLNDVMAALGLGSIENLLSGGSQNITIPPLIMNVLELLQNKSIQMLNSEQGFAVLHTILNQLGAILPIEQQNQLESGLNKTYALIGDLEICSTLGQDCLANVQNVFNLLGAMLAFGNNTIILVTPLEGNMTLPVAVDVLEMFLPWNVSQPAETSMEIVRKVQHFLEQAYASLLFNISQGLQSSNLTIFDLNQVVSVIQNIQSASILQTLNMSIQIPQCLNTQTPGDPTSGKSECVLQLIQNAVGLLGMLPVSENIQTTLKDWLNITAVEYQKLNDMPNSESDPYALTEEILITTLSAIRQNLQGLNVENVTDITNELSVLEDLMTKLFREQYPYHTINSTLMEQGQYAQRMYGDIAMWYLNKLGNSTNGSMLAEILHQLILITEMQVELLNTETHMVTLVMNEVQNLTHVQLPLEGEDLIQITNTIMTILKGELALIKGQLKIQQAFYNSLGSQVNISIPAEIEAQIMTYVHITKDTITNQQVTTALGKILEWKISSLNITTHGMDLEQLLQAMIPLLPPNEYLSVVEQISQNVNHALMVASSDGLQNENFIESIINAVRMELESIANETGALHQDVVDNILDAFKGSLELILTPSMSYTQANSLTQETVKKVEGLILALLPAEAAEVLVPITNSILAYLKTVPEPGGLNNWNDL